MRPLPRVWTSASVNAAAHEIRDSGLPAVGVTEGFLYVALVTQASLAKALAEGVGPEDSVSKAYDENAVTLPPYAPADRALELFSKPETTAIPIVDDYGHLMGVLTPADLFPKRDKAPRPQSVGGMATPFGVYLTNGTIGAGAKGWALVSTGVVMSLMLIVSTIVTSLLLNLAASHHLRINDDLATGFSMLLFLLGFRLLPLAGIHAAEHKVVHAIESGEDLTRENVRRMPRVHPRCGTNLVVGLTILTGVATIDRFVVGDISSRILVAAIATALFWRPLGSFVQYWGTTKEPNDKQIDMGIRSGEELLKTYQTGAGGQRSIQGRLWSSGIFHVMAGASATMVLIGFLKWAFHLTWLPIDLGF